MWCVCFWLVFLFIFGFKCDDIFGIEMIDGYSFVVVFYRKKNENVIGYFDDDFEYMFW